MCVYAETQNDLYFCPQHSNSPPYVKIRKPIRRLPCIPPTTTKKSGVVPTGLFPISHFPHATKSPAKFGPAVIPPWSCVPSWSYINNGSSGLAAMPRTRRPWELIAMGGFLKDLGLV